MTALKTLQKEIRDLVFFQDKECDCSFLWKDGLPKRIGVYRNNTRLNWSEALDQDFALTRKQFSREEWQALLKRYFVKHPPASWELNTAMAPFFTYLSTEKVKPWIKELADYEWHDLQSFIHRAVVKKGSGRTNPTAAVRVFKHQIFDWVEAGAPKDKPPRQKPEVLVFYRDSENACHIREADPLMLLFMEHSRKSRASLDAVEKARQKILPNNSVPLDTVLRQLQEQEIIL